MAKLLWKLLRLEKSGRKSTGGGGSSPSATGRNVILVMRAG